ncbi:Ribosomal protein L20 [Desmophyllum pertusum]|uniref:Large ribosomal subunit protein bL20c n=1 Tax=Desmophyllum pertusum TaxID=174260 RepID=A0A9X0D4Z2_9CNID|nr:Ribosomal protein L20 [Desmophyllum pertusum]
MVRHEAFFARLWKQDRLLHDPVACGQRNIFAELIKRRDERNKHRAGMVRAPPPNRALKRAKILALAKGFCGRSKNCYSIAIRRVHKALQYQYIGRRLKKREMRQLWINRINIATREHNVNYSTFITKMVQCNIQLNRKMLSELAIHEPRSFKALAELSKSRLKDGLLAAL